MKYDFDGWSIEFVNTEYDRLKSDHPEALETAEEHLAETEKLSATIIRQQIELEKLSVTIARQQIELDAWRSGRLVSNSHPDGLNFAIWNRSVRNGELCVELVFYGTTTDAVDALMAEEAES